MSKYPTAHHSEKALLSSVMRGGSGVRQQAVEKIRPDYFDKYEDLARVVLDIAADGRPDPETVQAKYDGDADVSEVAGVRCAPMNVGEFIEDVFRAHLERQGLDRLYDGVNRIGDDPILEVFDDLQGDLIDARQKRLGKI